MVETILLDVSFGIFGLLANPLALFLIVILAGVLIYLGIKAIRHEMANKKEEAAEEEPSAEADPAGREESAGEQVPDEK